MKLNLFYLIFILNILKEVIKIYFFQFNLLNKNGNLKEKGKFNLIVNYHCNLSCKECDNNNILNVMMIILL